MRTVVVDDIPVDVEGDLTDEEVVRIVRSQLDEEEDNADDEE